MIKKLDLYIIKKFLGVYVFSIILIISIAVVFDVAEKLDDFMERDAPLRAIIFDYYLNFIPYYANLFSSLFIFISVIFFTSKMAYNTEVVAILSSGISFNRFLRPYVISASILAIFSFYLNNYVIPPANAERLDFEEKYIRSWRNYSQRNIHRQYMPEHYFYLESYSINSQSGRKLTLEKFDKGKLVSKLVSGNISWDSTLGKWKTGPYYIRNIRPEGDELIKGESIDTVLNITPEDFARRDNAVEKMTLPELNSFIEQQHLQGSENVLSLDVHWHERFAFPFSTFILAIIGVSLSSAKKRGGIGLQIGLGIGISFSYIFLMQISKNITIGNGYNPFIGVWIPNFIYGIVAFVLYKIAPK